MGFHGGSAVKNSLTNVGDAGLIPKEGRSFGEGNGNPLQYSCLGNSMGRGDWWAIAHGDHKRIRHDLANKQYSIVYMYHNFFIHSSANGHLVGFHVQATVNSAAMNIGVFIIFKCIVLWY